MPILTSTGAVADLVCAVCGTEQHVTSNGWQVSGDPTADESVFTSPACPGCGSTESFAWHDWVYLSLLEESDDPAVPHRGGPDHTHFGARQMVLIERVARALGRRQRVFGIENGGRSYEQPPRAPTQNEVQEYARTIRGERGSAQ
jgi:hypothetical protein